MGISPGNAVSETQNSNIFPRACPRSSLEGVVTFASWSVPKLQSVQNAAAGLVVLSNRYDHITPILRELHWLPIKQKIIFKIILLIFKSTHGLAPVYLEELLKPYVPKRQLRSSTKNFLSIEPYKLRTYGFRAFSVSAPILWNSLPEEIRNCHSIETFKSLLKTHLFNDAFN